MDERQRVAERLAQVDHVDQQPQRREEGRRQGAELRYWRACAPPLHQPFDQQHGRDDDPYQPRHRQANPQQRGDSPVAAARRIECSDGAQQEQRLGVNGRAEEGHRKDQGIPDRAAGRG